MIERLTKQDLLDKQFILREDNPLLWSDIVMTDLDLACVDEFHSGASSKFSGLKRGGLGLIGNGAGGNGYVICFLPVVDDWTLTKQIK